ncbi:hypothetical protein P7K49_032889 [Saguinus oedipus]|uniref:Small glutamine-rich tetratricopeptide repeat-containing protein alpha n=1 Tax=Saguinus oedipus TaxID=9490 RepID=A0ABQ9TQC5_SAGOE|nr:hypothetical protein P7K49_032889 [Saguinus oedipus]
MKVENFEAAVHFYGKAIELNPANAVYFCNRAAAYSKLGNYAGAVQDCERAICIDPAYSKAYGRMGPLGPVGTPVLVPQGSSHVCLPQSHPGPLESQVCLHRVDSVQGLWGRRGGEPGRGPPEQDGWEQAVPGALPSLALSSLNKHVEAVAYYKKALELDPDNETYKSNLKIAEQKLREAPSPTGGTGSIDIAGLLNNPGFMTMVSASPPPCPPAAPPRPRATPAASPLRARASLSRHCWHLRPDGSSQRRQSQHSHACLPRFRRGNQSSRRSMSGMISGGHNPLGTPGTSPSQNDLASLIQAGQQFAQQMQQQNPELIEQLRSQIRSRTPSASNDEQQE